VAQNIWEILLLGIFFPIWTNLHRLAPLSRRARGRWYLDNCSSTT